MPARLCRLDGLLVVDEVQFPPNLLRSIKFVVDRVHKFTGSSVTASVPAAHLTFCRLVQEPEQEPHEVSMRRVASVASTRCLDGGAPTLRCRLEFDDEELGPCPVG